MWQGPVQRGCCRLSLGVRCFDYLSKLINVLFMAKICCADYHVEVPLCCRLLR